MYASAPRVEEVGDAFEVEKLHRARVEGWALLDALAAKVRPGHTTADVKRMLGELSAGRKFWHPAQLRLGVNTTCHFGEPAISDEPLKDTDIFFLDLGLIVDGYESDVGRTFVLGEDAELRRCADAARTIHRDGVEHWLRTRCTGAQLYEWTRARAKALGYGLTEIEADGHRIGDFPHHRFSEAHLVQCDFTPRADRWIYEVHVTDGRIGGFYEDLLSGDVACGVAAEQQETA